MRHETEASVRRRVAECWGFWFRVAGVGYVTDFRTLAMAPAFDEPGEGE